MYFSTPFPVDRIFVSAPGKAQSLRRITAKKEVIARFALGAICRIKNARINRVRVQHLRGAAHHFSVHFRTKDVPPRCAPLDALLTPRQTATATAARVLKSGGAASTGGARSLARRAARQWAGILACEAETIQGASRNL